MHRKILIALDESDISRPALDEGLGLAKSFGADVVLYYVLPNFVMPVSDMPVSGGWSVEKHYKDAKRLAAKMLSAASARAKRMQVNSVEVIDSGPDVAECIAAAAQSRKCDLIVIGSHGRTALQRLIFGSVVTRLITIASVPLVVCKKGARIVATRSAVAPVPRLLRTAPKRRSRASA